MFSTPAFRAPGNMDPIDLVELGRPRLYIQADRAHQCQAIALGYHTLPQLVVEVHPAVLKFFLEVHILEMMIEIPTHLG